MEGGSVLISGIGVAGPTLAYWLERRGFRPTLVERAPRLRAGGYVIDFWGLGYDIAERMGLLGEVRERGYDVKEVRIVDDHGRRVGGFGVGVFRSLTEGRFVSLARSDLAALIYEKIEDQCECLFGDSVTAIEQAEDSVRVTFAHAPPRRFDLVIGADGLHSVVRELAFGPEDRFEKYLGYVAAAAFAVDGYRPRDADVYVAYAAPGKQIARFAMRGDRTVFLFVFAADEPPQIRPHDFAAQKNMLHAVYEGAGWECSNILAALDACDEIYFDRVSQIRMEAWSRGRIALIGDAAFCPSLLAGQGAAFAMISAYVLAGELAASEAQAAVAFHRYEQRMQRFIAEKQKAAEGFARSFAPKTQLGLFLRNQVTKAFAIPGVAKLAMGPSLFDRLDLPKYGGGLRRNVS